MSTPHINANPGDFAKTVLMPGDPLRAKVIAETFLTDVKEVTNVRNMLGFTGYYKGKRVSVMGSGMGMPSIGIYSYELYKFYGVERIIRIGTAGSTDPDLHIFDLVIAQGASTNSNWIKQYNLPDGTFSAICSYEPMKDAINAAEKMGIHYKVGQIFSSDNFYNDPKEVWEKWADMGCLCVEMEAYALYATAAALKKEALAILTISDSLVTGEATSPEERVQLFKNMSEAALACIKE